MNIISKRCTLCCFPRWLPHREASFARCSPKCLSLALLARFPPIRFARKKVDGVDWHRMKIVCILWWIGKRCVKHGETCNIEFTVETYIQTDTNHFEQFPVYQDFLLAWAQTWLMWQPFLVPLCQSCSYRKNVAPRPRTLCGLALGPITL